ncbi:MAG: hypothetical protein GXO66_07625 [Euryarchaeota archaeon]|nr:hypothetical protein [Euryarchaeota archaeon]
MEKSGGLKFSRADRLNLLLAGMMFFIVSSASSYSMGIYYAATILAIYWVPKILIGMLLRR